jgi:hypothetical protein
VADSGLDSVDSELEGFGKTMRVNIALNPATAMRGSLPTSESIAARLETGGAAICFARNAGLSGAAHRRAEGFIHALTARRRPMANPPPSICIRISHAI